MRCIDYNAFSCLCSGCDFPNNIKCCKEVDFNKPLKYKIVESKDMMNCSFNICPTCGESIGYHPENDTFRCPKCTQKILWK